MNARQLRKFIVQPTLHALGMESQAAIRLVMGTAMQESQLTWIKQLGHGPALGLWQIEPDTHDDIAFRYLARKPELAERVREVSGVADFDAKWLIGNLWYGCAMCRLKYWMVPARLPHEDDLAGLAAYWKVHYNTANGHGAAAEWVANYRLVS